MSLTIVIPTRNRPKLWQAQLRLFRALGLDYPIIIADSSDPGYNNPVPMVALKNAKHWSFAPNTPFYEKLAEVARAIATPFVAMVPDDDITFPHAIIAALDHLQRNPDYVSAYGYVLNYGIHEDNFDIHRISFFTPSVDDSPPIRRLFHLMRRYQPFLWSVMRTDTALAGAQAASAVHGTIFQELTFSSVAVMLGTVARLPLIFNLRGLEMSLTPVSEGQPFVWFLTNPSSFFGHYVDYRNALLHFIRERDLAAAQSSRLEPLIDLVHASYFGREVDTGAINHMAAIFIGDPVPPLSFEYHPPYAWKQISGGDVVHLSQRNKRRYVWREGVLTAEPREEIRIDLGEIARVEAELDLFHFN